MCSEACVSGDARVAFMACHLSEAVRFWACLFTVVQTLQIVLHARGKQHCNSDRGFRTWNAFQIKNILVPLTHFTWASGLLAVCYNNWVLFKVLVHQGKSPLASFPFLEAQNPEIYPGLFICSVSAQAREKAHLTRFVYRHLRGLKTIGNAKNDWIWFIRSLFSTAPVAVFFQMLV